MEKRRKYNLKNKKSFMIIIGLSFILIGLFSWFIYKYLKTSKIEYKIETESILQDINKNYFTLQDDAILKIRMDGSHYLVYNKKKINLGKNVIVYNKITSDIKLYGTFYEIEQDGKIIDRTGETIVNNTGDAKFYKIYDREYLLIDSKIYSDDNTIEANNYLLVELDKAGNAKLSNNSLNLKTITPTKLITSKYNFEIALEMLHFSKMDIDLKKIIGSTNQYVPEEEKEEEKKEEENNTSNNNNNINNGIADNDNSNVDNEKDNVVNNKDDGLDVNIDEILEKVKMTSITRIVEGVTDIDIYYVIYDPFNEYRSVYLEFENSGKIEKIELSKTDNHKKISNLKADTKYHFNLIYTIEKQNEDETKEIVPVTYTQFDSKTLKPNYDVSIERISKVSNKLTYKVVLDKRLNISKMDVSLSFNYTLYDSETLKSTTKTAIIKDTINIGNNGIEYITSEFDLGNYMIENDSILKINVDSVTYSQGIIKIDNSHEFRFGGK